VVIDNDGKACSKCEDEEHKDNQETFEVQYNFAEHENENSDRIKDPQEGN
jgi:hypothetical protein